MPQLSRTEMTFWYLAMKSIATKFCRFSFSGNTACPKKYRVSKKIQGVLKNLLWSRNCVTQLKLDTVEKLSSSIFCCLCVCEASVTPDQISTFSNIYRHTSPLLTLYYLIPNSTNLNWPSTSQYRHILTQYHQVPFIVHYLVRHSSVNWIISLFTTHLMSHAQYTWSSFIIFCVIL